MTELQKRARVPGAWHQNGDPSLLEGVRATRNAACTPLTEIHTMITIRSFTSALSVLCVLCVPTSLYAQHGTLRGSVTQFGTSQPIPGASIAVIGTRLGSVTDTAGVFVIERIPAGRYEIEAHQDGKSVVRMFVSVTPNAVATLHVQLADAPVALGRVEVIGETSDALARLPGSAAVITPRQLAALQPISANEALRTVPGVHLQEEEGAGLRANIGIRGLDPDRSRNVLVLEDGVPVALAPYGEPEMYYSPPIDRMERVEIIKGSGSILFGPQTVGGVVNYVTADAPVAPAGELQAQRGSGAASLLKAQYGGTWGRVRGTAGAFQRSARDFNGLEYQVTDGTMKLGGRTGWGDVGLKLSVYDEASNATYVGLTDSMYRASPRQHPAPDDRLDIRRYALTGTHTRSLASGAVLRTNLYGYETTRNWNRRDYTYAPGGNALIFRNTTGSRNRTFDVAGLEPRLQTRWSLGGVWSDLDLGVRAHVERARDRHLDGTVDASLTTVREDEVRTGRAVAAFVQNRFFLHSSFHITPGLRFERFQFDRHILRMRVRRSDGTTTTNAPEDVDIRNSDVMREVIPGVGAAWTPSAVATVFAGVHRGFAPPRTKDALIYGNPMLSPDEQVPDPVSLDLDAERSWNYELGARMSPTRYLSLEATAFYLDFSNQIVTPSLSAGSVAQGALANQGATRHRGAETALSLDVAKLLGRAYSLSAAASYTFVDATFSESRRLRSATGDTIDIVGNRLPYAPRHQATASLQFEHPQGVALRIGGVFVGEQFSDNFETLRGSANGRVGLIPAYRVYDASARIRIPGIQRLALTASVKNLAGSTYIASRRPEGIKPGLSRVVSVGATWKM